MNGRFFERDGVDFVAIKTNPTTEIELVATEAHKAKFKTAWAEYSEMVRAHNEDGTFKADDPATPEAGVFRAGLSFLRTTDSFKKAAKKAAN